MSKDFDDTMKQIIKNGKQLNSSEDNLSEIKEYVKTLNDKIESIDQKLGLLIDIINNLSIFIDDESDDQNFEDTEEWSPYNSNIDYDEEDIEDDYL
jgi:hypothetical protein